MCRADHSSKGVLVNVACVTECDLERATLRRLRSTGGCCATREKVICWGLSIRKEIVLVEKVKRR